MSKRIKHVFGSAGEVAHIWAQQCQEWGRNGSDNIFFKNETIFSYGYHFPIARFHKMPNGKTVVLYDNTSYSSSTSMHQGCVCQAVNGLGYPVIKMPHRLWHSYIAGKEYLIHEIKEQLDISSRATKYAMSYLNWSAGLISRLHVWGKLYRRHAFYKFTESEMAILKRAKGQKVKLAAQEVVKAAKEERLRLERIKVLNEECDGDLNMYWRKFGLLPHCSSYSVQQYLDGTLCRVVGDEVVTSMGAKVPIKHAKRLLIVVKICHDKHRERQISLDAPLRIGYYQVQYITAEGDIKIGCHDIKWSEVELLGKQLMPDMFGE